MNGWGIFFIILILALILGLGGWILYTRLRARRLGLPPPPLNPFSSRSAPNYPAPAPGGIRGWIDGQIRKFKNRRHATGNYEETGTGAYAGTRGRGAGNRLDPDEAWDARVGNEAYYEEQELGLHAPPAGNTAYGGGGYGAPSPGFAAPQQERGRSRQRELDERYEEEMHGGAGATTNPFGDDNASSLRGVSPRPVENERTGEGYGRPPHKKNNSSLGDSPTERRSMFRENM